MITPLFTQMSHFRASGQYDQIRPQGRLDNPGDVRQIDGFSIDVSGQASKVTTTDGPIVRADFSLRMKPEFNPIAPAMLASIGRLMAGVEGGQLDFAFPADAQPDPPPPPPTPEAPPVDPLTFSYGPETEAVAGVGYLPADVAGTAGELDYLRRELARAGALAQIEDRLGQEFGGPVKVAFDPLAEDYLMLRPGQPGYETTKSAREAFAENVQDLDKTGHPREAFAEVLAQYGVADGPAPPA